MLLMSMWTEPSRPHVCSWVLRLVKHDFTLQLHTFLLLQVCLYKREFPGLVLTKADY